MTQQPLGRTSARLAQLDRWFDSQKGAELLARQRDLLGPLARQFHGDCLLWLGCHEPTSAVAQRCMVRHAFFGSIERPQRSPAAPARDLATLVVDAHDLPVRSGAMDAVVLHHILECAEDPRMCIREVARIVAPGGRIAICGFNPWSHRGVRNAWRRRRQPGLRLVRAGRYADWLTVLGFDVAPIRFLDHGLPRHGRWHKPVDWLERRNVPFAGAFVLSAVRQNPATRGHWREIGLEHGKLAPVAYPKLSAWSRGPYARSRSD